MIPRDSGPTADQLFVEGYQALERWRVHREIDNLDLAVHTLRQARTVHWETADDFAHVLTMSDLALEDRITARPDSAAADRDELIAVLSAMLAPGGGGSADDPDLRSRRGWHLMHRYLTRRSITDLDQALQEFDAAYAASNGDDVYRCALNLAWAYDERFTIIEARGESYARIVSVDPFATFPVDLTGPADLVRPITMLEELLHPNPARAPAPPPVAAALKRNLANLLRKYAVHVKTSRTPEERSADLRRAVQLLEQALPDSAHDPQEQMTVAVSLVGALSTQLVTDDGRTLAEDPGLTDPGELARHITLLQQFEDAKVDPTIAATLRMALAALLIRRGAPGDDDRAVDLFRRLAATPEAASDAVSLEAAANWATYELSQERWSNVIEANQYGNLRVKSLMASQDDWLNKYRWTQQAGRLAAFAAYAHTQLGDAAAAVATLEAGRAIMITNHTQVPIHILKFAQRDILYLLYTHDNAIAICCTDEGDWSTHRLEPFLTIDEVRGYLTGLDAFHRDPDGNRGVFYPAVDDVLARLQQALSALPQIAQPASDLVAIPVGFLPLFPVAAALFMNGTDPEQAVTVMPTRALMKAPDIDNYAQPDCLLAVSDASLPASGYEERLAKSFFANPVSLPDNSTKAALVAALPAGGVVHFPCHARAEVGAPLDTGIRLPNGETLTVRDLVETPIPPLRLAVLSACETGVIDPDTPDEGISLAAAILAAGTTGVISTLWPVDDLSTTLLIARFYWNWRVTGMRPPLALNRAQRWQAESMDSEKVSFLTILTQAGFLTRQDAETMTDDLCERSQATSANAFAAPYFWAGFTFSGR